MSGRLWGWEAQGGPGVHTVLGQLQRHRRLGPEDARPGRWAKLGVGHVSSRDTMGMPSS